MQIYLYQNEQQVGPFTVEDIRNMIWEGSVDSSNLGWHEGLAEWQPLNSFLPAPKNLPAPTRPVSAPPTYTENRETSPRSRQGWQQQEVQTNVKQGAIIGGWLCFLLGVGIMYLSMWTFVIYAPLFLVAFILSIIAMSQRRVLGGIALLLATLVVPAIIGLLLFSTRTVKFAENMSKEMEAARKAEGLPSVDLTQEPSRLKSAAQNIYQTATVATTEGYDASGWTSVDAVISDLVKGVSVERNGQTIGPFKVDGLSSETISALKNSGYITLRNGVVHYNPDGASGDPVASLSNEVGQSPIRPETNAAATPPPSKNAALDEKNGFRTFRLGAPFSEFAATKLREGRKEPDSTIYYVEDFDKKIGNAEIGALILEFSQDMLAEIRVMTEGDQNALGLKESLIAAYGQPKSNAVRY